MKVLDSIENRPGDHCVDFFVREDGTFGFEEYRRDPEDASGWFSLHHYSHLVFNTRDEAVVEANLKVAWMERTS